MPKRMRCQSVPKDSGRITSSSPSWRARSPTNCSTINAISVKSNHSHVEQHGCRHVSYAAEVNRVPVSNLTSQIHSKGCSAHVPRPVFPLHAVQKGAGCAVNKLRCGGAVGYHAQHGCRNFRKVVVPRASPYGRIGRGGHRISANVSAVEPRSAHLLVAVKIRTAAVYRSPVVRGHAAVVVGPRKAQRKNAYYVGRHTGKAAFRPGADAKAVDVRHRVGIAQRGSGVHGESDAHPDLSPVSAPRHLAHEVFRRELNAVVTDKFLDDEGHITENGRRSCHKTCSLALPDSTRRKHGPSL